MKDTYYFRHDYNSRNDLKMQALIEDHGAVGFGLFWSIIEILHEEESHSLPLSAMIYKAIGKQMSTSVEQVEQVVKSCLSYGLFIQNGDEFYSERVNENIETRDEISALRSKAGKESAKRRAKLTPVEHESTNDEQNPTKKIKENDIKLNESKLNDNSVYTDLDLVKEELLNSEQWIETTSMSLMTDTAKIKKLIPVYCLEQKAKGKIGSILKEYKSHFYNWARIKIEKQKEIPEKVRKEFTEESIARERAERMSKA